MRYRTLILMLLSAPLIVSGCSAEPETSQPARADAGKPRFVPYVPATAPAPETIPDLPTSPRDAMPPVSLMYSIEIFEILLPRQSVSADEAFWKRVNESAVELAAHDVLFKNGIRVGELPVTELASLQALAGDRQKQISSFSGIDGKQIEFPVRSGINQQTIFFFNRENQLVGRSYDRSDNILYFSFETTPRKPDQIRLALSPAVRAQNKKLQYSTLPGKLEREITYTNEEVRYDACLSLDLPLSSLLVIAPSVEARDPCTLGSAFFLNHTPSEQQERLILIVPRAYKREGGK
ncbi:MAG: hypothetical protein H7144_15055 [Burkholderiales bacterium]|nr:hypothetical protein [Phycisphaerae bacterium]